MHVELNDVVRKTFADMTQCKCHMKKFIECVLFYKRCILRYVKVAFGGYVLISGTNDPMQGK